MRRLLLTVVCAAVAVLPVRGEDKPADPLLRLPVLAKPKPVPAAPLGETAPVAPGIATSAEAVVLDGRILFDTGPVDGLEVLACLEGGKYHESLVRLATGNGQLVKFAVIRVLGLDDGQPAQEGAGVPARGTPVRVLIQWASPDDPTRWLEMDASSLVRDRLSDAPYPPLPFVYTGSRIQAVTETGPDGATVKRERFMLDSTKSVAVAFDEPDALLASPFPGANVDQRFEVYSAEVPPQGTPVRVVIRRAELPLTLIMDGEGVLRAEAGGLALDDAALAAALAAAYGGERPGLRAVGVRVHDAAADRAHDVAARQRLLAAAAAAKAWVVPIFLLK
jgi:hypothetical protein